MPLRTQLFSMVPWVGGLDTSQDEAMIQPNMLRIAENVVFGVRGSRQKRDGINHNWASHSTSNVSVVALHDYWFQQGAVKTKYIVSIREDGSIYAYDDSGIPTDITPTSFAWTSVPRATMAVFGNILIMGAEGTGNALMYWDGVAANAARLQDHPLYEVGDPAPPDGWILRTHFGRILCNDKANPDFLHFSETNNPLKWLGAGDSGGFPVEEGDGDPEGITAIFPTFKGQLFVGKATKIYNLSDPDISISPIRLYTEGVGVVGPNAIAPVDVDDVYWASDKGIHRLSDSNTSGGFKANFVSATIQETFNNSFERSRFKYTQARYHPPTNSVAFTFTSNGDTVADQLYLYNIPGEAWYQWTGLECESLVVASDSDTKRFYFGRSDGKVSKSEVDSFSDTDVNGTEQGITMRLRTGFIFPDGNPYTYKGFKKFALVYRPDADHALTVCITIDNHEQQCYTYTPPDTLPLLGVSFILGVSSLGDNGVMAPYAFPIDGYGRGFSVEMTQEGTDEQVEIQGFIVEYEAASTKQEVAGDE